MEKLVHRPGLSTIAERFSVARQTGLPTPLPLRRVPGARPPIGIAGRASIRVTALVLGSGHSMLRLLRSARIVTAIMRWTGAVMSVRFETGR